jgi:RNA ligase
MRLDKMLDISFLQELIANGYVRRQVHPSEPLAILNYAEKTGFEKAWNDVTRACRGLIYNVDTLEVVARPFYKFFNYEELGPEFVFPSGRVTVTDKQDGSLGILYPLPSGGWAVATRGSFASDQALHATKLFNDKFFNCLAALCLYLCITYLFYIIYPENRIVLNYGDMDALVLLGSIDIETGKAYDPVLSEFASKWDGPRTFELPAFTLAEALTLPDRKNKEGMVVYFHDTGLRVKIKQADYVALHRIVTGMNERAVWERMSKGESAEDIKLGLPEEFWSWVDRVSENLISAWSEVFNSAWSKFWRYTDDLGEDFLRKDFAVTVKDDSDRALLFKILDNQDISDVIWKQIKPEAGHYMAQDTEG